MMSEHESDESQQFYQPEACVHEDLTITTLVTIGATRMACAHCGKTIEFRHEDLDAHSEADHEQLVLLTFGSRWAEWYRLGHWTGGVLERHARLPAWEPRYLFPMEHVPTSIVLSPPQPVEPQFVLPFPWQPTGWSPQTEAEEAMSPQEAFNAYVRQLEAERQDH